MAELGLAMGNDAMGGMEEMHYALGPDGQYQPVMPQPHELGHDQPFPQGQTGGQTFASTLLLSFSCSPLLKQHLLRSLHMTNEELASLEPVLSNAWDQWDHARRVHYAEQAAKASGSDHTGGGPSEPHPYAHAHVQQDGQSPSNDFRVRFHRPLTAPSPFRTMSSDAAAAQALAQAQAQAAVIAQQAQAQQQQQQQRQRHASSSSASPSEHHNENAIDPSLSAGGANGEHGDVGEGDEGSGSELDAAGDDGEDGGDKE
ncbi:hypothetical protein BD410DRAFT_785379 [Rickenella mellea]|uniref:Uncharacterized protein n=1 Tax=Rickenella mellea TaxID=50990 RepID=A0A4Y7QB62_9AGAM|nr:hypothetical protein BD410DRAFT_785379 [Rickenella mellea]